MIDSPILIASFASVLQHIQKSDFAEIALVIENAAAKGPLGPRPPRALRVIRNSFDKRARARFAYGRYIAWDRKRTAGAERTLQPVDCTAMLADQPRLVVEPIQEGLAQRFPADAVRQIRNAKLDVILRFGFDVLKGDILRAARYGIWSYHHADPRWLRGGPPAYWELAKRRPYIRAVLQVLNERLAAGRNIAATEIPTAFGFSVSANMVALYQAAEPLVICKLHQLHERGWDAVLASAPAEIVRTELGPVGRIPEVNHLARFIIREGVENRLRKYKLLPRQNGGYWRTALRRVPSANALPWSGDWSDFRWCAPQLSYLADPVLFDDDGRTWLFVESFRIGINKGHIACAEVFPDGSLGELRTVLEAPYHISMPHVFRHDGAIFMIPETAASGKVELYRATDFPYRWKKERCLLDKPGLDTNLHLAQDGQAYFFTSLRHGPQAPPNLFLFRSNGLFEPWELHPANPYPMNVRFARNAGPLVQVGNSLYRSSQDMTIVYGRRMHFHEILKLNPLEYQERLVGRRDVPSNWGHGALGTHTYSRSKDWEATDAYFPDVPAGVE